MQTPLQDAVSTKNPQKRAQKRAQTKTQITNAYAQIELLKKEMLKAQEQSKFWYNQFSLKSCLLADLMNKLQFQQNNSHDREVKARECLQAQITRLKMQLEKKQSEYAQLQSDHTQLQSDHTQLQSDHTQQQKELFELQLNCSDLSSKLAYMKDQQQELQLVRSLVKKKFQNDLTESNARADATQRELEAAQQKLVSAKSSQSA